MCLSLRSLCSNRGYHLTSSDLIHEQLSEVLVGEVGGTHVYEGKNLHLQDLQVSMRRRPSMCQQPPTH